MIRFEAFVRSIHDAVLSANDALASKNLQVLHKYFEAPDDVGRFEATLDEAVRAARDAADRAGATGDDEFQRLLDSLEQFKQAVHAQKEAQGDDPMPTGLRPRMTTVQYPHQTADGVVMSDVSVPLIALAPMSMTQVSEVKFRTELEVQIAGKELSVTFPTPQSAPAGNDATSEKASAQGRPVATLEITLTPHHGTEGLRKLVEGYEKVLRAQIPS